VTTQLHRELMALALQMRQQGREEICFWIMKHVAAEQKAGKRRRGEPKVKVVLGGTGREAFVPKRLVEDALERGSALLPLLFVVFLVVLILCVILMLAGDLWYSGVGGAMIEWIGDEELQAAVVPDEDSYAILTVAADGTLTIVGPKWKECPGVGRCRRPGRVRPPERCAYCSWSGHAHLRDREQATRVAAILADRIAPPTTPGG